MKKIAFALLLLAVVHAVGSAQTVEGTILSHSIIDGGARVRVAVAETVSTVVLESKMAGSESWTKSGRPVANLAGSRQVILRVPPRVRANDLRVRVQAVRPAPAQVAFKRKDSRSSLQVEAGLAAGTTVSAEYFDRTVRQWKRFAAAQAPENTEESWSIPVPRNLRAMQMRITKLGNGAPGSESARFPTAFRTGDSQFPGRAAGAAAGVQENNYAYASTALASGDAVRSATSQVEESDIWKIAGTKIYFFNQLRGLQVIETANTSEPEIVSFLRMPAVGEDMYVLPGSRALLVRGDWRNGGTTGVVLVDVSLPQAKIISELQVPGWYSDSRLVDGRLVLATSRYDQMTYQSYSTISVIDDLATAPRMAAEAALDFSADAMGTGSEYLWVSGSKNWSWTESSIALFPLSSLPNLDKPLRTELGGMIYDKFKVHQKGEALFAVTQRWNWGSSWRQRTALESYSLEGEEPVLLQSLKLVEGESLHATRFDGDRAYVVTFEQIDPLWIVDLSDPAAMRIESELQVPGWSTYIEPIGGYLAAVGVDGGKVTASLFDVRDPTKPFLSDRVDIGEGYTWSEANWDEKAVAIIPESGLILLPYSSFNSEGDVTAVQLVDMDTTTGKLNKRGVIRHAFTPRRADALREGILASISNRELFLLDASDRNNPVALAEVTLAFGADRILGSRDGMLIHAESGDWRGSDAMLRVSSIDDPDAVTAEASLGDGDLIAAELRGKHIVALLRGREDAGQGRVVLFDATKLPELVKQGDCSFKSKMGWNASVDLVWPSENLAIAAIRTTTSFRWFMPYDIVARGGAPDRKSLVSADYYFPYWNGQDSVSLHAIDLSDSAPRVVSSLDLSSLSPRNTSKFFAADGLVIFSTDRSGDPATENKKKPRSNTPNGLEYTFLQIVDYAESSAPYLWPETVLPGRLDNIAEFDRSAGLLFAFNSEGSLEALLYEGGRAHSIAALPSSDHRSVDGRVGWTLSGEDLSRYRLTDDGNWTIEDSRADRRFANPSSLRAHTDGLLLRRSDELVSTSLDLSAPIQRSTIPGWSWWWMSDLSNVYVGAKSIAVPTGEYGIELFDRAR